MDIRLLDEQDREEIEGKLGNLSSLSTDNKTSLVNAINEVSDKTIIQKYEEPTIDDKDYRIGQLWYSEKSRNIYVLNKVDEDGAYWDIFLKGGQIQPQWIYGFEVDEDNLNPRTAVTYIGRNKNFTPARVVDGKIDWGSWEQFVKDISYRVVVKNGVEQYKVQYDDPTKKLDGSPANLTGADGDLFTKFKLIYRKYTKTAKGYKIELSDAHFEGARSLVSELEDGYNQFNNPIMILLQDLYLLLFKDRDSQTALGRGHVDDGSKHSTTGGTNGKGYIYGETTGKLQMCFLGIEDLWGNKYQRVDGLVSNSSYNLKVGTKNFNDSGTGYTTIKTATSSYWSGYFKSTVGGEAGYILADDGVASSSTGYCDSGNLNSDSGAYFGGNRSDRSIAGAFYVRLTDPASFSDSSRGTRLCFKNTEGVYVGNYLGYVEGTKLRSIVGKIPTGDKTIGQFRTYAQNNN